MTQSEPSASPLPSGELAGEKRNVRLVRLASLALVAAPFLFFAALFALDRFLP
mgnify:CR=1 FL=1